MPKTKHFPEDFNATDFHSGAKGGNKLDHVAMLSAAQKLFAAVQSGAVKVVGIEHHEIAQEGQPPRDRIIIDVEPT